jgi:ribonuclease-3
MEIWANAISQLEQKIQYTFKDKKLIGQALTHSSFANEQKINQLPNYERIEFLGDAVLELVASQYFYENFPNMSEGQMTKQRSAAVCEPALAHCGRAMDLGRFILLGRGEEHTGGRRRDSIIADVLEGVIGALYLDGGLPVALDFINRFILSDLKAQELFNDNKTMLQEFIHQHALGKLSYKLVAETGPEHDKEFHVELFLDDIKKGGGVGKNKKAAEQQAAFKVLASLRSSQH